MEKQTAIYADKRYEINYQMAQEQGLPPPISHICPKCSRETLNYGFCEICVETEIKKYKNKYPDMVETEITDMLYELECEAWYRSQGY